MSYNEESILKKNSEDDSSEVYKIYSK